jgi:hypothetical protein
MSFISWQIGLILGVILSLFPLFSYTFRLCSLIFFFSDASPLPTGMEYGEFVRFAMGGLADSGWRGHLDLPAG